MQIFIIGFSKTNIVDIEPSETILRLKELINDKLKVPIKYQRLTYAGKSLRDDYFISDYNLQKDCSIFLHFKWYIN